ncbi:hypothetical protein AJ79_00721 [Helicocarpus griseus UAMH5409]|uniref:PHD-type domain-containing protein n=1 Tax=Helicocarpus griseus UAMH5409 TaxID=1447875 RepID=A0A2B7YAM8_9EURO|nr:hypothetical protein AJ79_00721 [Helicocarpus griseus UAMH5409]
MKLSDLLNPAPDTNSHSNTYSDAAQQLCCSAPTSSYRTLIPLSAAIPASSSPSHTRHSSDPFPQPFTRANQLSPDVRSSFPRRQSNTELRNLKPIVKEPTLASVKHKRSESYNVREPSRDPPPHKQHSTFRALEPYHHGPHTPSLHEKRNPLELNSSVPFALPPIQANSFCSVASIPERAQTHKPTMATNAQARDSDDDMDIDTDAPSGFAENTTKTSDISPYETDAQKIPQSDRYLAWHPHYGRYRPSDDDFKPNSVHCHSNDDESLRYWETVLTKCDEKTRLNTPTAGKRDIFAWGSVIVKSDHSSTEPTGDYSSLDENEACAITLAVKALPNIRLPEVYLRRKIKGRDVLVQSRIPGVSLEVAWPYLSTQQRENFKEQARNIIQQVGRVRDGRSSPGYVVKGDNPKEEHHLQQAEYDLLFGPSSNSAQDLAFVHNRMLPANIIVDNDTIVGIVGWYDAGYFGWERARNVHQKLRCCGSCKGESPKGGGFFADAFWNDLYNIRFEQSALPVSGSADLKHEIKAEPPTPSLEYVPRASTADTSAAGAEPWTPKKITDLKRDSMSRASSMDPSSPAPSTKPSGPSPGTGTKKRAAPTTKKGTIAKKPAAKKRKLNSNDNESADGTASPHRRSATPISSRTSKAPAAKNRKQSSLSVAGSPAPETKKAGKAQEPQEDVDEDDEDEDSSEIFCICRRPDNHTWMIGCDGGCEDWFHGKCVKINQEDADLIDKYICPACEAKHGTHTTWKRMCRLSGCRQPARVFGGGVPSKYCSDEHGREFMLQKTALSKKASRSGPSSAPKTPALDDRSRGSSVAVGRRRQKGVLRDDTEAELRNAERARSNPRDDDDEEDDFEADEAEAENGETDGLGSRGGILTRNDLKAAIMGVKSAQEFRGLGDHILPPSAGEKLASTTDIIGVTSFKTDNTTDASQNDGDLNFDLEAHQFQLTTNERQHIQNLRMKRTELRNQLDMLRNRDTFLTLVRQRAKSILEQLRQADPKSGTSTWKDICGYDSRLSWSDEEFNEWRLSDAGKEALRSGILEAPPLEPDDNGDTEMQDAEVDGDDNRTVEKIARGVCIKKRCERHRQWVKVQQQDMQHEERIAREELEKCGNDSKDVMGRIVLRIYGDEDNGNLANVPAAAASAVASAPGDVDGMVEG